MPEARCFGYIGVYHYAYLCVCLFGSFLFLMCMSALPACMLVHHEFMSMPMSSKTEEGIACPGTGNTEGCGFM